MFRTIEWDRQPRIWLNWVVKPNQASRRKPLDRVLGHVITIDDERSHPDRVVRGGLKETLKKAAKPIVTRERPLRTQTADQGWGGYRSPPADV
jgi:hypothetical protein